MEPEATNIPTIDLEEYLHGIYLKGLEDIISLHFSPQQKTVFRIIHNPTEEKDFIVGALKNNPTTAPLDFEIPTEELTLEEKIKRIGAFAYSVFETFAQAESHIIKMVGKRRSPKEVSINGFDRPTYRYNPNQNRFRIVIK